MGHEKHKRLKKADEDLISALACGATIPVAAQRAGVSERTVYRRLDNPKFRHYITRYRADTVRRTSGFLTAASPLLAKTLLSLTEPGQPPSTRLGACRTALEMGIRLSEMHEIEERLAVLEEQMLTTEAKRRHESTS